MCRISPIRRSLWTSGADCEDIFHAGFRLRLFPRAYLLILVRDRRAVVESKVRTTNGDFESAVRQWAEAAGTIVRFDETTRGSGFRYLIVKYDFTCSLTRIVPVSGLKSETAFPTYSSQLPNSAADSVNRQLH